MVLGRQAPQHGVGYDPMLVGHILHEIARGRTVTSVLSEPDMPSAVSLSKWCEADATLKAAYQEARDRGLEAILDNCVVIADGAQNAALEGPEVPQLSKEQIAHAKLRTEVRLKALTFWDPKKYAQRHQVGGDPDNPVIVQQAVLVATGAVDELLALVRDRRRLIEGGG
jgi:hypothetical protein